MITPTKKTIIRIILCFSAFLFFSCQVKKGTFRIDSVIALAKIFDSGEKISGVIVKYTDYVHPDSVSFGDYLVPGRTIKSYSVNRAPVRAKSSVPGPFVILELGDKAGPADESLQVSILQQGAVRSASNEVCKPQKDYIVSSKIIEDVVQDFWPQNYIDDAGDSCPYYIYIPKNYSVAQEYPLVAVIPDGREKDSEQNSVLKRNRMAVALAESEFQKQHPCIVAVFSYEEFSEEDKPEINRKVNIIEKMLDHLVSEYAIDDDRIYAISEKSGNKLLAAVMSSSGELFAGTLSSVPNSAKENPWNDRDSMEYLFTKVKE